MKNELTAEEAWTSFPDGLNSTVCYNALSESDRDRFCMWLAYIEDRIAAERAAEIERLKRFEAACNARIAELEKGNALETAQLKSRIAELERPATPSPPKPRKTAGEKLAADLSDAWGTYEFPGNPAAIQSLAIKRGYTDDPAPPSDGELLNIAIRKTYGGAVWTEEVTNEVAIEFRRLLAERDGVQHENS